MVVVVCATFLYGIFLYFWEIKNINFIFLLPMHLCNATLLCVCVCVRSLVKLST